MNVVYHGSSRIGLKVIEPHKSTHGTYVYATPNKFLALHFSKRCGDDLTYEIGRVNKTEPFDLVENVPGAFKKMYANSSSIYTLSADTFKDIHTGFEEVVSLDAVKVLSEEHYDDLYSAIKKAEEDCLVRIYLYPNKPSYFKQDGTHILDKLRYYKKTSMKEFNKIHFDRLVCLHPELLDEINKLAKEFNLDCFYTPEDLIYLFKQRIESQLNNLDNEQFIDCSYISICFSYPFLKNDIDKLYYDYLERYHKLIGDQRV